MPPAGGVRPSDRQSRTTRREIGSSAICVASVSRYNTRPRKARIDERRPGRERGTSRSALVGGDHLRNGVLFVAPPHRQGHLGHHRAGLPGRVCSEAVAASSKVHSQAVGPPVVRSWKWMAVTGQDVDPVFGCSKRDEKPAFKSIPPSLLQPARVTATPRRVRCPTSCLMWAPTVVSDPSATSHAASTVT
jgi:hypothetical protein